MQRSSRLYFCLFPSLWSVFILLLLFLEDKETWSPMALSQNGRFVRLRMWLAVFHRDQKNFNTSLLLVKIHWCLCRFITTATKPDILQPVLGYFLFLMIKTSRKTLKRTVLIVQKHQQNLICHHFSFSVVIFADILPFKVTRQHLFFVFKSLTSGKLHYFDFWLGVYG